MILALLEETAAYDERGRSGSVARLILTELACLPERRLDVPMSRDARALRVARAPLENCSIADDLDRWAEVAGASRRTSRPALPSPRGRRHSRLCERQRLLPHDLSRTRRAADS